MTAASDRAVVTLTPDQPAGRKVDLFTSAAPAIRHTAPTQVFSTATSGSDTDHCLEAAAGLAMS